MPETCISDSGGKKSVVSGEREGVLFFMMEDGNGFQTKNKKKKSIDCHRNI